MKTIPRKDWHQMTQIYHKRFQVQVDGVVVWITTDQVKNSEHGDYWLVDLSKHQKTRVSKRGGDPSRCSEMNNGLSLADPSPAAIRDYNSMNQRLLRELDRVRVESDDSYWTMEASGKRVRAGIIRNSGNDNWDTVDLFETWVDKEQVLRGLQSIPAQVSDTHKVHQLIKIFTGKS